MYKTIRGLYKKGEIIPIEPILFDEDEIELFITFIREEKPEEDSSTSADHLLYSMGERALNGSLNDASEKHDKYLYSREKKP